MRVLMTEDSNNAVSNSFLLDDNSRSLSIYSFLPDCIVQCSSQQKHIWFKNSYFMKAEIIYIFFFLLLLLFWKQHPFLNRWTFKFDWGEGFLRRQACRRPPWESWLSVFTWMRLRNNYSSVKQHFQHGIWRTL